MKLHGGRLRFEKCYYDRSCSSIPADVIVCRHVIEHIPHPVHFLETIKDALVNSPQARLFFETPCLEWILKHRVVWDFFYEHCSYYTKDSLSLAFEKAGFQVEYVKHVFSGQYLWLEATIGKRREEVRSPREILDLMNRYVISENDLVRYWEQQIHELLRRGKVAIWGAGAKGVTFASLLDPKRQLFECIVDINPRKQNHFLPGSGHPIVGFEELKSRGVKTALLMNPCYFHEVKELLLQHIISTTLYML